MTTPNGTTRLAPHVAGDSSADDLSVEEELTLNRVCDAFEMAWRAGERLSVERAVDGLIGAMRRVAVREVIALDAFYRRQQGDTPAAIDYTVRFPDLAPDELAEAVADTDPNARTATAAGFHTITLAPPAELGEQLGDFVLEREIARGGMGVVYRARQVSLDRLVALKVVRAGEFADPDEVRRFRAEAEAAATLDHPHIVSIYEVGEARGVQFYAMRLIEGGSLAKQMGVWAVPKAETRAVGRSRQAAAAGLMAAVARAVHHAHQRGILHRDLKPGNILLDTTGEPHVTDFGLARRIGRDSTLTRTGAILGTPSYMAPEQARGREDVTTGADVYGLGAVLYELLAGRPPFAGEDVLDTLYQVREREPAAVRSVCPWVDRDLETVCLKCLEKDPTRRYSSAAALADDLGRYLAGVPVEARPVGWIERLGKSVRRNRELATSTAVVILSLATGTAVSIWQAVRATSAEQLAHADRERALEAEGKAATAAARAQLQAAEAEREGRRAELNLRLVLLSVGSGQQLLLPVREMLEKGEVDPDTALRIAHAILAKDPENEEAWKILAEGVERLGRHADALAVYERAVRDSPGSAAAHNQLAWFRAMCSDPTCRDPGQAVQHAREAVALARQQPKAWYWNTYGVAHYRAEDWPTAIAGLKQSIALGWDDGFNSFFLAMTYARLGNRDEAKRWYELGLHNQRPALPIAGTELRRIEAEARRVLGEE